MTFVGPSSDIISVMGDKASARNAMRKLNIPIIPGSLGIVNSADEGLEIAKDLGVPVIIKASSGGGGRGMRIVNDPNDFKNSFDTAQSEAKISFNDTNVYIEKYCLYTKIAFFI